MGGSVFSNNSGVVVEVLVKEDGLVVELVEESTVYCEKFLCVFVAMRVPCNATHLELEQVDEVEDMDSLVEGELGCPLC